MAKLTRRERKHGVAGLRDLELEVPDPTFESSSRRHQRPQKGPGTVKRQPSASEESGALVVLTQKPTITHFGHKVKEPGCLLIASNATHFLFKFIFLESSSSVSTESYSLRAGAAGLAATARALLS